MLTDVGGDLHARGVGSLADGRDFVGGRTHRDSHVTADRDQDRLTPVLVIDLVHVLEIADQSSSHAVIGRTHRRGARPAR
jgi:hypothetical protein